MRRILTVLLAAGFLINSYPALAQYHPDPLDLNMPNVEQETNNWCWAAVIVQILDRYSYGDSPSQCDLVNMANIEKGDGSVNCCVSPSDPACDRFGGNGDEMSFFLQRYGVPYEVIEAPETPEAVYEYLNAGKALMVQILMPQGYHHLFLVTGIYWEGDEAILRINNPAVTERGIASFDKTRPGWRFVMAIG